MSAPRKRRVITLHEKKEIIKASAKKGNHQLAKDFGISRGTIQGILKEKDAIFAAVDGGSKAKRVHLKSGKHDQMEEALVFWHKQVRSQNIPVSGDLLTEKALAIATQLGITDFEASKGWLEKFKDRYGIRFEDVQGEAGAVLLA